MLLACNGWRLPSEAEWEYVAREGRAAPFLRDVAASFREGREERTETTWGIADLGSREWVGDRWHDGYEGAPSDSTAWTTGEGAWMSRGSFPAYGFKGMQCTIELAQGLSAYRNPGMVARNSLRLTVGPDEAGVWRR